MPKEIVIDRGIEPFDDRTDFTRNNKERQPFGKTDFGNRLNLGSEYDVTIPVEPPPVTPAPTTPPTDEFPFKHKLANGTELKAKTVEELAQQIENNLQQAPQPPALEFEDKPLYEGYQFTRKELTLQQQADILNVMKENPQKAFAMLQEAETGATTAKLLQVLNETQMALRMQKEMEAGVEFLGECEDFSPTKANSEKLTKYLREKGKPITVKNLTVAFRQLSATDKSLLMKIESSEPEVEDKDLTESPAPPTIVPSNQGRPEAPSQPQVDVAKFAAMSLDQQKKFFADLRRQG